MATLLSPPSEIRSMILLHAANTEMHICKRGCSLHRHGLKPLLTGPNLNLLFICRQIHQENTSLNLRSSIIISANCMATVYRLMSPNWRQKGQLVLKQWATVWKEKSLVEHMRTWTYTGKPHMSRSPDSWILTESPG
jgi:hypothetical protein